MLKQMVIVANNMKIENCLQNVSLTVQRQVQSLTNKRIKHSTAITSLLVEEDEIFENEFAIFNEQKAPADVLSHQFSARSDYCQPVSFGFHSAAALRYRTENPKQLENLFIGAY